MAKNFSLDALQKNVEKYNKTKKITAGGFNVVIDVNFSPTKIGIVGSEMIEASMYLASQKIETNTANLVNYFIIKNFSDIGYQINAEISKRLADAEDQSSDNLLGIKTLCNLKMCENLINAKVFEDVIKQFDSDQLEEVYKTHTERLTKLQEHLDEQLKQVDGTDA